LREKEERLRQFFENEPAYCYMISPEGVILDANGTALRALGYTKEELLGKPLRTIYAPESLPKMNELFGKWKEAGALNDEELVIITKEGNRRTVLLSAGVVRDRDGRVLHSVSVQKDITDLKRAEEKLKEYLGRLEEAVEERTRELTESEARMRSLLANCPDSITIVDRDARIRFVNRAIPGLTMEELVGRPLSDFTEPEYHDDYATILRQVFRTGQPDSLVTRALSPDGGVTWFENRIAPIKQDGHVVAAMLISTDVTERRQAQAALIQAEKLAILGRLAASLVHEINNPLQSVISCLGLVEETLAEGGDAGRYLEVAVGELRRAARTVAQLRDLQRPMEPRKRTPADVNGLLEQMLTLTRKRYQEQQVELGLRLAEELPPLMVVPDRIQQVFLNLVLNAIDAMPQGGQLQVATARTSEPAGVSATFTDSGVGIPSDALPHIFDAFYSGKPSGIGLGLFISQTIVEDHGGYIEVESREGEGIRVTVWLPA